MRYRPEALGLWHLKRNSTWLLCKSLTLQVQNQYLFIWTKLGDATAQPNDTVGVCSLEGHDFWTETLGFFFIFHCLFIDLFLVLLVQSEGHLVPFYSARADIFVVDISKLGNLDGHITLQGRWQMWRLDFGVHCPFFKQSKHTKVQAISWIQDV